MTGKTQLIRHSVKLLLKIPALLMIVIITGIWTLSGCQSGNNMKQTSAPEISAVEPVIDLSFDESSGTSVHDTKGTLEDGYINYVFNSAKYQPSRDPQHVGVAIAGKALLFDGYSTYIEYENAKLKGQSLACTVWVAPRAFEWGDNDLPSTIVSQYDASVAQGFQFGIYRHGSYGVEIQTKAGQLKLKSDKIPDLVEPYAWTQLAFSYNAETSTLSLYRNGQKVMEEKLEADGVNPFNPSSKSLLVGKNNDSTAISVFSANMFNGVMDELKLYDQPLSEADVLAQYQQDLAGLGGNIPAIKYADIALNADNVKADVNRPTYHLAPPEHWMNEPHGAFYYKGYYHIFYQHNPFGPFWHQIHWGHLVSTDMIHWKSLPDALVPTFNSVAPDGIWSGSTTLDRDGNPVIFFTAGNDSAKPNQGVAKARPKDLADPYLTEWVMDDELTVAQQEGQGNFGEFRDPYVWFDAKSDAYYMLVCSGVRGQGGTALAYRSKDLNQWEYFGPFLTSDYEKYFDLGEQWELPVLMTLKSAKGLEKDIFLFSPQGKGADVEVFYFTGQFDRENVRFIKDSEVPRKIDLGNSIFTGPSGFLDPVSGKNILFTIAQGEREPWDEYFSGWAHNGGMPLELSLDDKGNLKISPVKAVDSLHTSQLVNLENVTVNEANEILKTIKGDALDIDIQFAPTKADSFGLNVRATEDLVESTKIYYDNVKQGLYVNRLHSSLKSGKKNVVGDVYPYKGDLNLRILLDRSLIEVYANNERSLTARIYPSLPDAQGLSMFAEHGDVLIRKLTIHSMASIY